MLYRKNWSRVSCVIGAATLAFLVACTPTTPASSGSGGSGGSGDSGGSGGGTGGGATYTVYAEAIYDSTVTPKHYSGEVLFKDSTDTSIFPSTQGASISIDGTSLSYSAAAYQASLTLRDAGYSVPFTLSYKTLSPSKTLVLPDTPRSITINGLSSSITIDHKSSVTVAWDKGFAYTAGQAPQYVLVRASHAFTSSGDELDQIANLSEGSLTIPANTFLQGYSPRLQVIGLNKTTLSGSDYAAGSYYQVGNTVGVSVTVN